MRLHGAVSVLILVGLFALGHGGSEASQSQEGSIGPVHPVLPPATGGPGSVLPMELPPAPSDILSTARERATRGNLRGATALLADWLDGRLDQRPPWRQVAGIRLVLGLQELEQGNYNLASEQFTRVRLSKGPLAPWGAWYEALADHMRGRHAVAARECTAYLAEWPEGRHARQCRILRAEALTAAGQGYAARKAWEEVLDEDPDGADAEVARLGMALAQAARNPGWGISALQAAALDYTYPTTRRAALTALEELAAVGMDATMPDDLSARMRLAASARRAREHGLAWELYTELAEEADDPRVTSWVEAMAETFGWGARRYDALADHYIAAWRDQPNGERSWMAHRALARAGRWEEAAEWGERGVKDYGTHSRWRHGGEDLARAWMMAGDHEAAMSHWDELGGGGGAKAQEARWMAAYSAYRAALQGTSAVDAEGRLGSVAEAGGPYARAARYHLARLALHHGDGERARGILETLVASDAAGDWYGYLAASRLAGPRPALGRWPGTGFTPPSPAGAPMAPPAAMGLARPSHEPAALTRDRGIRWAALRGGVPLSTPSRSTVSVTTLAAPRVAPSAPSHFPHLPPPSVFPGSWHDPVRARAALARIANQGSDRDLPAALALADVGLHTMAGDILLELHMDLEEARLQGRASSVPGHDLGYSGWRDVAAYTGSWHLLTRYSMGLDRHAATEEERGEALAMAWPLAYPELIWPAAREEDVDPFLLLAIMRQESRYNPLALSSASAMGVMQVMPATGGRIAYDTGRSRYIPQDLWDPATNISFGAWYLARLLDRFQGSVPLAVAGYNAGPTNVASWLAGHGEGAGVDDFVEQIPIEQTRTYVKKVLAFYATYNQIYMADGPFPALDVSLLGDNPAGIEY